MKEAAMDVLTIQVIIYFISANQLFVLSTQVVIFHRFNLNQVRSSLCLSPNLRDVIYAIGVNLQICVTSFML